MFHTQPANDEVVFYLPLDEHCCWNACDAPESITQDLIDDLGDKIDKHHLQLLIMADKDLKFRSDRRIFYILTITKKQKCTVIHAGDEHIVPIPYDEYDRSITRAHTVARRAPLFCVTVVN